MGGRGRPSIEHKLHWQKQNKHIRGSKEFIPDRSEVIISLDRIRELFDLYHGTGIMTRNNVETVNFHEMVGYYVNMSGKPPLPTSWVNIHFSADGRYHIVPANPLKSN